jgi:hypothetical protein
MKTYTPRPPGYWDAVHVDYSAGEKMGDIYTRHGCTKGEFDHHRQQAGWPMRHRAPVNRERLLARVLWLINRHLAAMEKNADPGAPADVAMLSQLMGSLERLSRLAGEMAPAGNRVSREAALKDIREKLVRRIEELKRD